ncbi:protein of unknown function [Maridesulfovibrio hydrothermalis AM13 = DSM 14728]|uniref:Uncharacterized protein n=1 Tax=Maridesulfovibrio hydrothermalis AM13 = DSM 14728 TaxID=1121451 RepID=L0R5N7_9BACT|nr:protein of unknown function [Maridesulfovibrio hydrothermalis AM13 = DSM 14728]
MMYNSLLNLEGVFMFKNIGSRASKGNYWQDHVKLVSLEIVNL